MEATKFAGDQIGRVGRIDRGDDCGKFGEIVGVDERGYVQVQIYEIRRVDCGLSTVNPEHLNDYLAPVSLI